MRYIELIESPIESPVPEYFYHGTDRKFDVFKKGVRKNFDNGQSSLGFFFATTEKYAQQYTATDTVVKVRLNLGKVYDAPLSRIDKLESINPRNVRKWKQKLVQDGYNSINFGDMEYVVFDASQIDIVEWMATSPSPSNAS